MNPKLNKREIIAIIALIIMILLFLTIVIVVKENKDNIQIEEKPLQIDENAYIKIEDLQNEEYTKLYKSVNVKRVAFKNIKEELIKDFDTKQNEIINIINSNIDSNKEFIDNYNLDNNITNYEINSTLDSIVLYDMKDDILSVLYLVEDKIDYKELNNNIINIFIDVKNNKVLSSEELLTKYNNTKENISKQVLENVIKDHKNNFGNLTQEQVKDNQIEYINKIVENFDNLIYLYFNEENIYLKYNKNEIYNLLFNEKLSKIKYSTLKIETSIN